MGWLLNPDPLKYMKYIHVFEQKTSLASFHPWPLILFGAAVLPHKQQCSRMHSSDSKLLRGKRAGSIWCMRVRACVCVHTHIHTYIHPYTHTCTHTCIHTYIQTYTRTYIHTCIHTYIHTHIHAHIHTYTHTHIHTYIHTCIPTYPYVCMDTYIRTYMHAF